MMVGRWGGVGQRVTEWGGGAGGCSGVEGQSGAGCRSQRSVYNSNQCDSLQHFSADPHSPLQAGATLSASHKVTPFTSGRHNVC